MESREETSANDSPPVRPLINRLGDFELLEYLGGGSFADTMKAERLGSFYAVKILRDVAVEGLGAARFEREVQALRIEHPNLVEYAESGVAPWGGKPTAFIAMPFVAGEDLKARIGRAGVLPWTEVVGIARAVCQGLAALHANGAIHRDVKPGNILLPTIGNVLLLDFGLAKLVDRSTITVRGAFVGTPAYASPEQLRGEPDAHTDLYAVGATMFHMLVGRPPFTAGSAQELNRMIVEEEPEPPSLLRPEVPPWLDDLVLGLLRKEPLQRPADAKTVAEALAAGGQAKIVPVPYEREQRPILALRATTPSASQAIAARALDGQGPDLAVAAITQPKLIDDIFRAQAMRPATVPLVDTRVETTASAGFDRIAALRGAAILPPSGEPYSAASLRRVGEVDRLVREELKIQVANQAGALRAAAFPFDSRECPWLSRNVRLLDAAVKTRDALAGNLPLYGVVRCRVEALMREEDRVSIANRFARAGIDGLWVEVEGLSRDSSAGMLVAALDFLLLLQEAGRPVVATIPGWMAEFAWSCGVAGIEVSLGRVGGASRYSARARGPMGHNEVRFEFPSLMTSLPLGQARTLLASGATPESQCGCPSCLSASTTYPIPRSDEHNLEQWTSLQSVLEGITGEERLARFGQRLDRTRSLLTEARREVPALKHQRHVKTLGEAFELVTVGDGLRAVGMLSRVA